MARLNTALLAWNRGRISPLALARTDIERVALSAETQTNWMPRILGSMSLRNGLGYLHSTYGDAKAYHLNFVYALSDQAVVELTNNAMRVKVSDVVITRPSVTSTIANGTFDSNLTSWTDADESGATSQWVTGGYMGLTGTETNSAIRTQQVTVSGGNISVEHGVRVKINRGVVKFKIGSTAGGEEYVSEATLREGEFSFAFTPTGDFHISVSASTAYESRVDSITTESAGDMVIPTAWALANLPYVRYDQSGDIIYVACDGIKQYKIERRSTRSWGIAEYLAEDGPFRASNLTPTTIAASAISGDITLTASKSIFKSTSVGSLYRITSTGQTVSASIAAQNTFTDSIRVTGVGSSRTFTVNISGTWVATVSLQRSIGDESTWEDTGTTYTANTVVTFADGLDNQVVYYRLGIKTGNYTSGTAVCSLTYSLGSNAGIVRITAYSSGTSVSALVLENLGGTAATDSWEEGAWSPRRLYPSSVVLYEGRLWWAGKDNIYGSVSDAFESYDDTIEGDSGPIIRSLGSGPVDTINWLLALQRLVAGAETSEKVIRSNSLDEPLSPTVFNIKSPSTKGSSAVAAVKVDASGLFVRNGRLFELQYDGGVFDYKTIDLTSYIPEIGGDGFTRIAVQRYPDTRIHCIKSDGTAAVLIFDRNEDMKCWVDIETDGLIEDVIVTPAASSAVEDSVYYTVKRSINGSDVRFYEKFSLDSECVGGTQNKQADAFISGTQASSTTISGLSHLEGESVIVWANGVNYSPRVSGVQTTFTVTGGAITLSTAVTSYVVGLPYKARYKSSKLAYAAQGGTALLQSKRIEHLGVIMRNTHNRGLRYGKDFSSLYEMPEYEGGKAVGANDIWAEYDERPFEFSQEFDTDSRLCLEAMAPMPCTLLAAVMTIATNDRV
jgi:hypothetical protein